MARPFLIPLSIITSILLFCEVDVNEIYTYFDSDVRKSHSEVCVRLWDDDMMFTQVSITSR